MLTEKLYEKDGMTAEFSAVVVSAEKDGAGYRVILDRTAFFPEGGGQTADTGTMGAARVRDVRIDNGEIIHFTDAFPGEGRVECRLDFEERFRKMQNHLGEHLLCGAIHRLFGFENVGFHLGSDYMTFDISGQMSKEQIALAERAANEAVAADVPVICRYPSAEELETLEYRAKSEKLEGAGNIRIVEAVGYDRCACCAPHLDRTGRVGLIKIVDSMHYKGGMRFFALCGFSALADYAKLLGDLHSVAASLSAKTGEVPDAVSKKLDEISALKQELSSFKRAYCEKLLENAVPENGKIVIFDDRLDDNSARGLVNEAVGKADIVCAFYGGEDGYRFVMGSLSRPLKEKAKEIQSALGGRCGGSDRMLFGSSSLDADSIRDKLVSLL